MMIEGWNNSTNQPTVIKLFRPVGLKEHELIKETGKFPPRLPHQPIFYPVLYEDYAIEIARDWNTRDEASDFMGFVTIFYVNRSFLNKHKLEPKRVGKAHHIEYWIPADLLDELNQNIDGEIKTLHTFSGKSEDDNQA